MSKIFLDPGAWTTCMSSNGETTNTLKLCTDQYNSQTMYRHVQLSNYVQTSTTLKLCTDQYNSQTQ